MSEPTPPSAAPRVSGVETAARDRGRAAAALASIAPAAPAGGLGGFWANAWPFPSVVFSAFLIAWGAECAQFLVSQGLALAILAWLQALPEFAVEAVIAWSRQVPYMTANFTGSLRLLVGLGWPLIFAVAAASSWMRERRVLKRIHLEDEQCIEIVALGLPIAYFLVIYAKGTLALWDAAVLVAIYATYLWVLQRMPPRDAEHVEDIEAVPRAVMRLGPRPRVAVIVALFVVGGGILYVAAEPFLHSMLRFAAYLGVSQYLFIQWVAPFLSEFPEGLSMTYWARTPRKAPMALMNLVSANINQWTMLAAMIPIVYSFSMGAPSQVPFDDLQRREILLTIAQSMLGMLLLANMSFHVFEAGGIFALWAVQFVRPHLHTEVTIVYFSWVVYELFMTLVVRHRLAALSAFARVWRAQGARGRGLPAPNR